MTHSFHCGPFLGLIAGGYYGHNGGGGDYICLPDKPIYGPKHSDAFESTGGIYGAEYEVNAFNPFNKNVHDHDAPCVVCYVKSRDTQIMMPARNDCPYGWTQEYHGFLMTEHYEHTMSRDYICVDHDPQSVPGSKSDHNGALLFPVQPNCDHFSGCPPYNNGWELTCSVCTK